MKTMTGKVCVVTGGTSGIGGAIAGELASLGAHVVLVGRSVEKGQAAAAALKAQTQAAVDFVQADLFSQQSIRALAATLEKTYPRIDVLVNNVGGAFWKRGVTGDGVEQSLALNLITPYLLTELLLPVLKRSAPARIVNVATKPRKGDLVNFDDLQSERRYDAFSAYGKAKTGLLMYTFELARRLAGTGVTVNALHPGVVPQTEWGTGMPKLLKALGPIFARLSGLKVVSLAQAADTAVFLASSPEAAAENGKYFVERKPAQTLPQAYDPALAAKLWDACQQIARA